MFGELETKRKVVLASTVVAILLIALGTISGDPGLLGNLIIISIFTVSVPLFIYRYSKFMWLKAIEEQFPNFVRDLADAIRSGMSMAEAIRLASKANYGKLTPEIQTMANRISWGTSVSRVLEIFGKKVGSSRIITEALNIMKEAQISGGDVAATLDRIAIDIVKFKEVEAERESMMRQHVMIMYGVFFMFLGISIMIIFVLVPMIKAQPKIATGTFAFQFTNPCEGVSIFPCNLFNALGPLFGLPVGITLYYTSLFFIIVLIQGFFTGLIAGQLGENSIVAGMKHSLIMVSTALGIFIFLAKAGLLPG